MKRIKPVLVLIIIILVILVGINESNQPLLVSSIGELLSEMEPQEITLVDGDEKIIVKTAAKTVNELLNEQKVVLNEDDIVIPNTYHSLDGVTKITIIRVSKKVYSEEIKVPFRELRVPDKSLYIGQKIETSAGVEGINSKQTEVTLANEKTVAEQVLKITEVKKTQDRVIKFGIKDTVIVDNKELKIAKYLNVKATAYTKYYECTGKNPGDPYFGITASGLPVEIGHIAVDPKIIPLHSKVYVVGKDKVGNEYTGVYTATDIGGAIKGNRIDIFMEDIDEMYRFGVREMEAFILKNE